METIIKIPKANEVESVLNDDQYRPLELSTFKFASVVNATGREDISNGEFIQRYLNAIDVGSFIVCIDFGVAANDRRFTPPATIRITGLSGYHQYMLVSNILWLLTLYQSRSQ